VTQNEPKLCDPWEWANQGNALSSLKHSYCTRFVGQFSEIVVSPLRRESRTTSTTSAATHHQSRLSLKGLAQWLQPLDESICPANRVQRCPNSCIRRVGNKTAMRKRRKEGARDRSGKDTAVESRWVWNSTLATSSTARASVWRHTDSLHTSMRSKRKCVQHRQRAVLRAPHELLLQNLHEPSHRWSKGRTEKHHCLPNPGVHSAWVRSVDLYGAVRWKLTCCFLCPEDLCKLAVAVRHCPLAAIEGSERVRDAVLICGKVGGGRGEHHLDLLARSRSTLSLV
jgi:hypothetical protein